MEMIYRRGCCGGGSGGMNRGEGGGAGEQRVRENQDLIKEGYN